MAAAHLWSEDHFLCSICLEVFTRPVSAPCGHHFCRKCIGGYWSTKLDCPVCRRRFSSKPPLQVDGLLSQMVLQFRGQRGSKRKRFQVEGSRTTAVKFCPELIPPLEKKAELKRVRQFAVDLTLDPDSANPWLVLSDDRKRVHHGDQRKNLPETPESFSRYPMVVSKETFSSGRFYFEVQVKGKTEWKVGVASEPFSRRSLLVSTSPLRGFWTLWLDGRGKYRGAALPSLLVSVEAPPQKVGVFVDLHEGLVSFYDADSADLIHFFTDCSFTGKLRPYFCPGANGGGRNSAPLILAAVNQTS